VYSLQVNDRCCFFNRVPFETSWEKNIK